MLRNINQMMETLEHENLSLNDIYHDGNALEKMKLKSWYEMQMPSRFFKVCEWITIDQFTSKYQTKRDHSREKRMKIGSIMLDLNSIFNVRACTDLLFM